MFVLIGGFEPLYSIELLLLPTFEFIFVLFRVGIGVGDGYTALFELFVEYIFEFVEYIFELFAE